MTTTFVPTVSAAPMPKNRPTLAGAPDHFVWWDGSWWAWDGSSWVAIATHAPGEAGGRWGEPFSSRWAGQGPLLEYSAGQPVALPYGEAGAMLVMREGDAIRTRYLEAPAGTATSLPRPPVPYVLEPHGPGGMASVRRSVDKVAAQIAADFRRREVIEWARGAIADAGLPGERGRVQPDLQMGALFAALKATTVFVRDPVNTEAVASTVAILCLDPGGACLRGGDCDDMLVALGSAAHAIGIPVRLCTRTYPNARQGHIVLQYDSARTGPSVWKCLDPSTDSGVCSSTPYLSEIITDVDTGSTPMFVGIGETAEPSTLGDPPAQTMSQADAQGWITLLSQARTQMASAAARLAANAAAYAAVRSDLGFPAVDATPAATDPGAPGSSPLVAYVNSVSSGAPVWTQAAATAEAKLLSTATFLESTIADALAGVRALTYQNGDLFIAAKPGDPYGVLIVAPTGGGTPALQYVDVATNAPEGTVGILPVIALVAIAGAVAVLSLASAYAVSKYCEFIAQTHHDDAMIKISNNETALQQQGVITPDQATAQTKALTDLAKAAPPASTAPTTADSIATVAKWIGVAAVAIAAVYGLSIVATLVRVAAPAGRSPSSSTSAMRTTRSLGSRRRRPIRRRNMRAIPVPAVD